MFEIPAEAIEPGTYSGVLESVEIMPSKNPAYPGEFRKWSFLIDVKGTLQPISASSSLNNGPKTKTYRWLKALLRRELHSGEKIESPIGQRALVVVENNERGYATITDLLPLMPPEQVVPGVPR